MHIENEWRVDTEEYKGYIVIEVKSSGEVSPRNIKFNAYYIGDRKVRYRMSNNSKRKYIKKLYK